MQRTLFATAIAVLTCAAVVVAEDPKPAQPAQPKAVQPKAVLPVQPGGALQPARPLPVTAARMAQLEEEFETLEAHRDVKKAFVRAGEVGLEAAKARFEIISQAAKAGTGSTTEAMTAKYEMEMAKAQLEIRMAELKEVEVKIKFSKKRLDDAKAAGVRPAPGVRPVPVDPNVRFGNADEKAIEELKVKIAKLTAEAEKKAAEGKKADAELKVAEEELAKIKEIAMRGRVKPGTIEAAEAKVAEAKAKAEKIAKERKTLEAEIATLQKKLKGSEN